MTKITNDIEVIISSALENLDLIQTLTDCITHYMSFDEDSAHWIGMSVRESVTNAIQHGNKLDLGKKVDIRFEVRPDQTVHFRQGSGKWIQGRRSAESSGCRKPAEAERSRDILYPYLHG